MIPQKKYRYFPVNVKRMLHILHKKIPFEIIPHNPFLLYLQPAGSYDPQGALWRCCARPQHPPAWGCIRPAKRSAVDFYRLICSVTNKLPPERRFISAGWIKRELQTTQNTRFCCLSRFDLELFGTTHSQGYRSETLSIMYFSNNLKK